MNGNDYNSEPNKPKTGKAYVAASYVFLFIFLAMIAYMAYFQFFKSRDVLNSPYNTRQTKTSESVIKGSLLSRDGRPIAYTEIDEDKNEIRRYPCGSLFAQTVGYSDYGSAGLEATQNYLLVQTHAAYSEQIINEARGEKTWGDSVITSFDLDFSQAVYDILGDTKGAVIVLNADDNSVLANSSNPSFNPVRVAEEWEILNDESSGSPFLNRALQGLYPPGSTFKIVTALAYLREYGVDNNFHFTCTGEYECGGYTIHCSGGTAHGEQDLSDAFANSCNCAFAYMTAKLLSSQTLNITAENLKFNTAFNLALPSVKSSFSLKSAGENGLTMQTAIGQGNTLMTPVHLAMIASAVYNGGTMYKPNYVLGTRTYSGTPVSKNKAEALGTVMDSAQAAALKDMMRQVVTEGTGSALASLPYEICGKTGTAQYNDSPDDAHSWFVGFSDTQNCDIIVAVIIEGGQNTDVSAVNLAGRIFSTWFALQGR